MKIVSIAICVFFLFSCQNNDPQEQKSKLSGYWEIKSVTFPDGVEKNYSISTTIDYIEVKNDSGIRKKVAPKLDGTFTTSNDFEKFVLKIEEDSLRLYYSTPFDSWKETVILAKDSILKVKNRDAKVYTYKKFRKFSLSEN